MAYNHKNIDKKWQKKWLDEDIFKAEIDHDKEKFYALDMFPYPSGSGLHVGHLASYTPGEIVSRYKRTKGFNVLHPMGFDAFGLPAEQYAIQTGIHPEKTTHQAIENFRRQLQSYGYSFDWDRQISTCDPQYYKWTQYIFTILYKKGLAYQKEAAVNWCPALKTVLANDEVIDGKSERGGHPVIQKPMKQWMLKITNYSEQLLQGLDEINWPQRTKEGQKNWIGKSIGAKIDFSIDSFQGKITKEDISVFTTRPDTLFGVTFMVLAPEHPLVKTITIEKQKTAVETYISQSSLKSEMDRKASTEKTGIFTGAHAINPLNGYKIPIWIADYVLMNYGTGAIMAVPGHDSRDFEFAEKFDLPIKRVIDSKEDMPFEGDGALVNSDFLNGLSKADAINKIISYLESEKKGTQSIQYKLRDWLFSRQRYWGEPFPVVHLKDSGTQALDLNELPIELPNVANFKPTDDGAAVLSRNQEWTNYTSSLQEEGSRETNTMPGAAGSSWYFLRYCDPHNDKELCSKDAQKYWMPVDLYIGGAEHTVGHLLYSRFWQKALYEEGLVLHNEPFNKLAHQGMILGSDGEKMSKSRGNVINVDDVQDRYGADAVRVFVTFLGPMDKDKPWSESGIDGAKRFLDRVWRLCLNDQGDNITDNSDISHSLNKTLHKTIKKVTTDIESMNFNTAISSMMILVNELYKENSHSQKALKPLCQLLMPFAPHIAEELWERMGGKGFVSLAPWPTFEPNLAKDNVITMGVQVNGKMRGTIEASPDETEESAMDKTKSVNSIQNALEGKNIIKIIYKPGKILNIIAK